MISDALKDNLLDTVYIKKLTNNDTEVYHWLIRLISMPIEEFVLAELAGITSRTEHVSYNISMFDHIFNRMSIHGLRYTVESNYLDDAGHGASPPYHFIINFIDDRTEIRIKRRDPVK